MIESLEKRIAQVLLVSIGSGIVFSAIATAIMRAAYLVATGVTGLDVELVISGVAGSVGFQAFIGFLLISSALFLLSDTTKQTVDSTE